MAHIYFPVPTERSEMIQLLNSAMWSILFIRRVESALVIEGDAWLLRLPKFVEADLSQTIDVGGILVLDGELLLASSTCENEAYCFLLGAFYSTFRGSSIQEIKKLISEISEIPISERHLILFKRR